MPQTGAKSANFGFLLGHDPLLDHLGALAERYFAEDPSTCLLKLRQLGEALAQRTAAHAGLYTSTEENQAELPGRLRDRELLPREIGDLFHGLRKAGNAAAHDFQGEHREALYQLRMAWKLGAWFHRTFKDARFNPGPFVPTPDPKAETAALASELKRLGQELAANQTEAQAARAEAAAAAERRLSAEQRAEHEAAERAMWEGLAAEAGREQARLAQELEKLQAAATVAPAAASAAIVEQASQAADALELDEADTRRLIDVQLRSAGWEVDSAEMTFAKGARPQKGKNVAVVEWPTNSGPADYVLFVGLLPVAVVEAKPQSRDVPGSLEQAKRYSRGYSVTGDQIVPGGPWDNYAVPFLFATNGRPFLRQLAAKSGIWFLDARRPENLSRALEGWYTPEGLAVLLKQDVGKAEAHLQTGTGGADGRLRNRSRSGGRLRAETCRHGLLLGGGVTG